MTLERAWVLLFLIIPVGLAWSQWNRTTHRIGLLLKAVALAAVILALAEPVVHSFETKVAHVLLVDTSAGISAADLQSASDLATRLDRTRGRNELRVLPFARKTRPLGEAEVERGWSFRPTAGDAGRGTDLESALRDAIASVPAGTVPRVGVVSDGNENQGSVVRAAWLAKQLGIPVDTWPMQGRQQPSLRIETVSTPSIAFAGEKFPITLDVSAPSKTKATLDLFAEGKRIGTQDVSVEAGSSGMRVHTAINTPGAMEITGVLKAEGQEEVRFHQAITLKRPRVIYFSGDPAGTEKHLLGALTAAQFQIDRSEDPARGSLRNYQLAVFNNQDLDALPTPRKEELERYVREGGGLLVIGGERNVYREEEAKVEDALDRALPAKLAPPRTPEGRCVVLIVDKSSSMEGRKMDLARVAAVGVIENLRPQDSIGVLIFDNTHQWAVPIRRAEDRNTIKRIVSGITPDGGTQIAPALAEGYRRIAQMQNFTYRHVVLLTDGISEEGDSLNLAKDASTRRVTISTVGLGQDVNRAYLEKIAQFAKGRSYFLTDPSGLEQILIKDVMEHTGSTAVEKPITPVVVKKTALLEGVPMESAPALKGYVRFISKPGADVLLKVDKEDPLLGIWQYGLGRAGVFASDAKSRWAEAWIGWPGFDKFWINVFRDLLPHSQAAEALAGFDAASGNLYVEYKLAEHVAEPATAPDIFVLGPDEFRKPLALRKVALRTWRGELPIGTRKGLFRIRPLEESLLFPETGLYRQETEMTQFGSNPELLRRISEYTGGLFNPDPSRAFGAGGRSIPDSVRLWPGLLALAIALNLAELTIRKWDGIVATVRGRA